MLSVVVGTCVREGKGSRAYCFREDQGCDRTGSNGVESYSETARRELVVLCGGEYDGFQIYSHRRSLAGDSRGKGRVRYRE